MRTALNSLFYFIFDLLAPARQTELVVRQLTLERLFSISREGSLPYHDARVKALVWELKYRANPAAAALAGAFLAEELLAIAQEHIGKVLIIPMPMHGERKKERGHNQTEVLCDSALRSLGEAGSGFDYMPDILERTRNTAPQQGLAKHVRLKNVKKSMRVADPARVRGCVCVVVDDVMTSGATFGEARRALKAAGAREVVCVALARA